jgi:hypothetical protein
LLDIVADILEGLIALLFEFDAALGIGVLEPCIAGCRALLEDDSFHGSCGFLAEFRILHLADDSIWANDFSLE